MRPRARDVASVLCVLACLLAAVGSSEAAEGRFVGEVVSRWLPNGRDMELTQPFGYVDGRGTEWTAPAGTVVDGASIPRALWTIVGAPFTGKYRKASVIHDFACQSMARPWQKVHQVFFEAALAEGVDAFQAKLMYGAVYAWGPRWEIIDGKPMRSRDIVRPPSESELQELSDWIKGGDRSLAEIAAYAETHFPRAAPVAVKRVALVIGNAAYLHTAKLTNPRNDAADLAATFKALGYQVLEGFDLDKAGMDRIIRDFARALSSADAGVFFYAGHGLQVSGQNYLVPVDAKLDDASGLDFETVRLDLIHRTMERETKTNVLFLDACRDNPLARNLARAIGTRSTEIGRGLAAVESGYGTLISFSTQPGNVALDGAGRNSPFAEALIKHIKAKASTEDLSRLLIGVRNDVMTTTRNRQVPWENSALTKPFFFSEQVAVAAPAAPVQYDKDIELAFWSTVKDSKSPVLLRTYLERYPDGHFAVLAQALIEQLNRELEAKAAVERRQADARSAEDASRAAAVKQEQEQRRLDAAKQSEELAKAREELQKAQAAKEKADADRQAALASVEQARREAEEAKATQKRVIEQADKQAKVVSEEAAPQPAPADGKAKVEKPPSGAGSAVNQPTRPPAPQRPLQGLRAEFAKAKALRSVAISKDGGSIAVGGDDGQLRLWNPMTLKVSRIFKDHRDRISAVAFSPDGKLLASAGWDGSVRLWNLSSGEPQKLDMGAQRLYSLTFDPKVPLKYLLAGDGQGLVHIWDMERKIQASKPEEHDGPVRAISFFPDKSGTFVSVGADGRMRTRSFKSGMRDIEVHSGGAFYAGYSPDGATVLTSGGDRKLKLWRSGDFKLLKTLEGHAKYVLTAAFSPDGKLIVSGGGDNSLILWDAQTGESIRSFTGHEADVECVAFYADGTKIVSVSEDKTMRVWDVATGRQLAVAVGFTDGEYAAYAPDGRYTGSPGVDGHLKVLQDGSERPIDDAFKGRFFSPSGLAMSSR